MPAVITIVFTAVALLFASIVMNALRNPVSGTTARYTATFTDVAGLYVGNDVRIAGVQVGKVESIQLKGQNAEVGFSLLKADSVYPETVAAVRFQNLLGQRYVELVQPQAPNEAMKPGAAIPVERTIPSFDISKLFNGFRPLFQTFDAAQFNQFGEDLLRLIQGDGNGSGIGAVLRDLGVISKSAVDREAIFVRLMHNLNEVSVELGGKSKQLVDMIGELNNVIAEITPQAEAIGAAADDLNQALGNVMPAIRYAEHMIDVMTIPYYDFAMRVLPHTPAIIGALDMLPSLMQGVRDQVVDGPVSRPNFTCKNGLAELPGVGEVPFGDQNLVLCQ